MGLYPNKRIAAYLLALVLLAGAGQPAHADVRVGRDRALRSLAEVIVKTRFGTTRRSSGYLFGTNGNLLVPYHVVSDAQSVTVYQADIGAFQCHRVNRVDPRSDIAVLVMDTTQPVGTTFAHVSDSRAIKKGDTVHVLHNPLYGATVDCDAVVTMAGYARQLPDCYVKDTYAPDIQVLQFSGPFDSGSAGGLVLDSSYDLVGLIIGGATSGAPRMVAAMASFNFQPMLNGTYTYGLDALRTDSRSDKDLFDRYLGTSPQLEEFNAPMTEGYLAWFTPMQPVAYADPEFTAEINDKISKNWFYTNNLLVDNRPLREWSAARICLMPASVNPWNIGDGPERLVHFDADSRFSKIIHKDRDTEERIMTRCLIALSLPPGSHKVQYENKGANYKSTGVIRKTLVIESGRTALLDITGLSLVTMKLLPKQSAFGDKPSVRYELERKPLGEREVNLMIRANRFTPYITK